MTIGELGFDFKYIEDSDRAEYSNFCSHHIRTYGRAPVDQVWHYTTADGLIEIIKTGKIFATHTSCLNDTKEQRYFGDLLHAATKKLMLINKDTQLAILLRVACDSLERRYFSTSWHYVACFSETEDDLGQWRGYGGGTCGYALGFTFLGLMETTKRRPGAMFLPMQYADEKHRFVINDLLVNAEKYFKCGILSKNIMEIEQWAIEFVIAFAVKLDIFASLTKHPSFIREMERRLVVPFLEIDRSEIVFRQKQTLLSRHLPIDITIQVDERPRLPLTSIYVGPGSSSAQRVSQVSVDTLLRKHGYENVPVTISAIPYRTP
jgi:hypothetical protein